jgi:chaperonin GroES
MTKENVTELKNDFRKEEAVPDPILEQQFEPIGDRVFCRRVEKDEKSQGGIIIPDIAQEKAQEGLVVAVGKGKRNEQGDRVPLDVEAGMSVILPLYGGTEIEVKRVKYVIVHEDDIMSIVHKPEGEDRDDG